MGDAGGAARCVGARATIAAVAGGGVADRAAPRGTVTEGLPRVIVNVAEFVMMGAGRSVVVCGTAAAPAAATTTLRGSGPEPTAAVVVAGGGAATAHLVGASAAACRRGCTGWGCAGARVGGSVVCASWAGACGGCGGGGAVAAGATGAPPTASSGNDNRDMGIMLRRRSGWGWGTAGSSTTLSSGSWAGSRSRGGEEA